MGRAVRSAVLLGGLFWGAGAALALPPGQAALPQQLQFDFKATVQADGSVVDIEPDAALPEPIRAMIRARVATWRYTPLRWQGNAVPSPVLQRIKAETVSLPNGGVALRVIEVTGQTKTLRSADRPAGVPMSPPRFPPELMRDSVNAVLVYSVLYDEAGKPQQVDLIYPAKSDRVSKRLDQAAREAIRQWVVPQTFGGEAIVCRARVPITFTTTVDARSLRVPPEVDASFEKHADLCPATRLDTDVVGTFL